MHRLKGYTRIKEGKNTLSLRGSMPSERIKNIDKEAHEPASTEDTMDQDSLEKNLTDDESQPKARRSNRIKSTIEDKIK